MGGVYAEPWLKMILLRTEIVRYKMVRVLFEMDLEELPVDDRPRTHDELSQIISRNYQWLKYAEDLARFLHDHGFLNRCLDRRLQVILSQLEKRVYARLEAEYTRHPCCIAV